MSGEPNWWPKLRRAAEANGVPLTEAVSVADIRHDDWCSRMQGTGRCDCDPDVTLRQRRVRRHSLDPDERETGGE